MAILLERITHIRDRDLLVGATQIFQHVLDEKGALGNIAFCIFTHVSIYGSNRDTDTERVCRAY